MKIKIGELIDLVSEEVTKTLLENITSGKDLVICREFNLNYAEENLSKKQFQDGLRVLFQVNRNKLEDHFYDDAAEPKNQVTFIRQLESEIGRVIREFKQKFPQGQEVSTKDIDRCELLNPVLSQANIQKWNDEVRPDLQNELDQNFSGRGAVAPELTDYFLHRFKEAVPQRWPVLLLNPKSIEDRVKAEEEKPDENVLEPAVEAAASYFSGAKLVPGFQGLDATFFDIGRAKHEQTGCMRVWRKVFQEEFGTAESLGATLGFLGGGAAIGMAHFKAKAAQTAGWRLTQNPYASLGQKLRSNWKFRGLRYGVGALLYSMVTLSVIGGPKVAAETNIQRKRDIRIANDELERIQKQIDTAIADNNILNKKKLQREKEEVQEKLKNLGEEPETPYGKAGRGFLVGASCIFGLYQTALLSGSVLKLFLNLNDFDQAVQQAMKKQVMSSMDSVFESFARDTGKHVDEDSSLFWGALYRDSKDQAIQVTDNQLFKFIEETPDGLVKFNGTEFKDFCRAFNSLDDVAKKKNILTGLGITDDAAAVLINRIKAKPREVGVNIQKIVKAMNGNVDKHLIPLMQTLRIISKNAANSNPEFARKSLLIILQRQTKNLEAITDEIALANQSLREASEILNDPRAVNQFLDNLAPKNVFNQNRPTIGGAKDSNGQDILEDVLGNLNNFADVFSGYARGSAVYRYQKGALVRTGIPEIGGDFAIGSYGKTVRLLRMQLEDLSGLEGQRGILRGISKNELAVKTIEDTKQAIKNLIDALNDSKKEMAGRLRFIAKKTEGTQEAMDDTFIRALENDLVIDLGTDATLKARGYSFSNTPPLTIREGTSNTEILNYVRKGSNINDPLITPDDLNSLGRRIYNKLIEIRDTKKFVFESSGRGVQTPFGIKRDGPREIGKPLSTGRLGDGIDTERVLPERKTIKKINLNILKS